MSGMITVFEGRRTEENLRKEEAVTSRSGWERVHNEEEAY